MAKAAKISVSLDSEDLAWAKKTARARRTSLSHVVGTALRMQRQLDARRRVLRQLPASSEEDLVAIDREWNLD